MRLIFWLYLLVKRQLKNPVIIAFIVMMPIIAGIITNVSSLNKVERPRVGIVMQDDDACAVMTKNYLINGDYSVDFYEAESAEALERDIEDNGTECGYIIGRNLTEKLDSGQYDGVVKLLICRSNFVSSMTNEIFFSAMFKAYSPEIAINYVKSVKAFEKHAVRAEEEIREGYAEYLAGDETFKIEFKILDSTDSGEMEKLEDKTGTFPVRPILMILVYIAGLFGIVQYYIDAGKGAFITLPKSYRIVGKPLYALIGSLLFAVSVVITLAVTGELQGASDIFKMCIYVAAVTVFAWIVATVVRSESGMIALIPVLLIACLILCPVFINITVYLPFTKYLRAVLLPWYMM